ncbi:hypothetical protein F66182_5474 [Fusarium sp. NRRL 66182]|nr:hypothetical protein F66182_5474 [Fusarium sp. NRRL 66182]
MTVSSPLHTIRPLGPIEAYSSSRHPLGLYRCVAVTARYTLAPNAAPSDAVIFAALANLINAHPMLRVGITGEDTNYAHFTFIPELNLAELVEFRTVAESNYEKTLEDVQAWCHDQLWPSIEARPPWRIIVLRPGETPAFEDVILSFHHSLMDGTSSKQFHEQLLSELNALPPSPSLQAILSFPQCPSLPEPQDAILNYTSSLSFWATTLWESLSPSFLKPVRPIWAGKTIDYTHPHKARVRGVDIPASTVASLLTSTRSHGTSITGLIHALVLASLSRRIPDAPAFISSTPINMRPYMSHTANPATKDSLRVCISSMTHHFSPLQVAAFRSSEADIDTLIWDQARKVKAEIKQKAATLPADDANILLPSISDWASHWREKDGQPRDGSWELSNIGCLDIPSAQGDKRGISRVLFTNGIMVAGEPMGISVASVPDGALTLGISWNEGVIEDEIMEGLAEDLEVYMKRLHEKSKFRID